MEEKMSEIIQLATPVLRDVSEFASVIPDASAAHVNFTPGTVPADTAAVLPGALKRVNAAADGAAAARAPRGTPGEN